MDINIYPNWECILAELSSLLCFEFWQVGTTTNTFGRRQNKYAISEKSYVRKSNLDDFIINREDVGCSSYARASVLYSLYACRHLVITDLEYQTYDDWKNKHQLSLDHKLPKRWFPRLTFDCNNWQPKSIAENINKGDDFLDEGLERLNFLSDNANILKQKYM